MAKTNVEIQDYQGNIIHPKTSSEVVDYKESNVSVTLDELVARKKVFVQNEQPETDGVWFDTSDNQGSTAEESPIVKNIRDYIDGNIKPPIDKNTQDIKTMSEKLDTGLNTLSQLSNPNLLINGDFQVWQRGTTFTNINKDSYNYVADRWRLFTQKSGVVVSKTDNGILINSPEGKGVVALGYVYEINKFCYGKKMTVSFDINSDVEYTSTFYVLDGKGVEKTIFKKDILITKTKQNFKITFTLPNQTQENLCTLWFGRNENIKVQLEINNIKMEIGDKATPFIPRSYGEELTLCQRYYETSLPIEDYNDGTVLYRFRNFIKADLPPIDVGCMFKFKVQKRGVPTVKFRYDFDDNKTIESDNPGIITQNYFTINTILMPLEKAFDVSNWIADAEIY